MMAPLPTDAPWWARWTVANIDQAWKWASMWWPFFCGACAEVYGQNQDSIDAYIKGIVPHAWWPHIVAAAFGIGMLLRVILFTKKKEEQK